MRRFLLIAYVLFLHLVVAALVFALADRNAIRLARGSRLTVKAVGVPSTLSSWLDGIAGRPMPTSGLDFYYGGVHLMSVAEGTHGLDMFAFSPPGSDVAWLFEPHGNQAGWESTVYQVRGVTGCSNIVAKCALGPGVSLRDANGDGMPEKKFETTPGDYRFYALVDEPWTLTLERARNAPPGGPAATPESESPVEQLPEPEG